MIVKKKLEITFVHSYQNFIRAKKNLYIPIKNSSEFSLIYNILKCRHECNLLKSMSIISPIHLESDLINNSMIFIISF